MIAVSTLLKSCATPPASWPTACILVAWATCRRRRFSSEESEIDSSTAASPRPRTPARPIDTGSSLSLASRTAMSPLAVAPLAKRRTVSAIAALSSPTTRSEGNCGSPRSTRSTARRKALLANRNRPSRSVSARPSDSAESRASSCGIAALPLLSVPPPIPTELSISSINEGASSASLNRGLVGVSSGIWISVCGEPCCPSRAKKMRSRSSERSNCTNSSPASELSRLPVARSASPGVVVRTIPFGATSADSIPARDINSPNAPDNCSERPS